MRVFARFCKSLQDSTSPCEIQRVFARFCETLRDSVSFCNILRVFASFCEFLQDSPLVFNPFYRKKKTIIHPVLLLYLSFMTGSVIILRNTAHMSSFLYHSIIKREDSVFQRGAPLSHSKNYTVTKRQKNLAFQNARHEKQMFDGYKDKNALFRFQKSRMETTKFLSI